MAAYADDGLLVKLQEIFPTLDEETIIAVLEHHHGDIYPAMLQLVELIGDDEIAEVTLAILEAEDLGETATQMDADEQLALALQQEFAVSDARSAEPAPHLPRPAAARPGSASKMKSKLSDDAKQLLVKFGRYRARTGTQRLLDPNAGDSAAHDARDDFEPIVPNEYQPPAPVISSTHRSPSPPPVEEGVTRTSLVQEVDHDARYNARMQRARTSNKRLVPPAQSSPPPESVNLIETSA